jgi:hypothetical protein
MGTEDQAVARIKAWFAERGYELVLHQPAGEDHGWFAPYMRSASRGPGSARYGWGSTPLEAAESAMNELAAEEDEGRERT